MIFKIGDIVKHEDLHYGTIISDDYFDSTKCIMYFIQWYNELYPNYVSQDKLEKMLDKSFLREYKKKYRINKLNRILQ